MQKNTHQYLVYELLKLNAGGVYDELILKCKTFFYHDFKSPIKFPKNQLVIDIGKYPALRMLCDDIIEGLYNEDVPDRKEEISNSAWAKRMLEDEDANEEIINKFLGE